MSGILQGLLASIGAAGGPWLYAWGGNINGRIGDNSTVNRSSPVQIGSDTTWSKIDSGFSGFTMAIKTDGTLWGWGRNGTGYIGDNTAISKSSPVQIGALTNWSQVACGAYHAAAIKTDGTLWTWGYNGQGQIGNSTAGPSVAVSSPIQIGALTNWSKIAAGGQMCLAIKTDGTLWSWGNNGNAQLGQSNYIKRSSPVQIGALTTWSDISCGGYSSMAIKTDGTLWTWGSNEKGKLGINSTENQSSPVQVGALTDWSKVACGLGHNLAIKTNGTLWSWGRNEDGQLGDNATANRSSPIQIGALTNWSKVAADGSNGISVAVKTDKTLWTWGYNASGQLGQNIYYLTSRSSPVQVGSNTWNVITCGSNFVVAIED